MTDDVFSDKTQTLAAAPSEDHHSELLGTIKNADGNQKYDSVEKALGSLADTQAHIAKLEAENDALREVATKVDSMDALLQKMQSDNADQNNVTAEPTGTTESLSSDQIEQLVDQRLSNRQTASAHQANVDAFNTAVVGQFGQKAKEEVIAKAQALGWSMADVKDMAMKNPKGTLTALGFNATPANNSLAPRTTVMSTETGEIKSPERKDYKSQADFYQAIKAFTLAGGKA